MDIKIRIQFSSGIGPDPEKLIRFSKLHKKRNCQEF
jgi:hypothetical protein